MADDIRVGILATMGEQRVGVRHPPLRPALNQVVDAHLHQRQPDADLEQEPPHGETLMSFESSDNVSQEFDGQVTLRRPAGGPQTFTTRFDESGSPAQVGIDSSGAAGGTA